MVRCTAAFLIFKPAALMGIIPANLTTKRAAATIAAGANKVIKALFFGPTPARERQQGRAASSES